MKLISEVFQIVKLKDVAIDMHQGINTVTENINYLEKGIPILQSKHITKGFLDLEETKYVSETDYVKYKKKYQPSLGDILICNIGTIGKSIIIADDAQFLIAWNLFIVKFDLEKIHPDYFSHYLNYISIRGYFDQFLTGGTVKFISKKNMANTPIPLPPLTEQKRIAAILDAADVHRQKTNQLITKYDDLSQSLFLDMFGDPVTNPKGWEKISLDQIAKISSGSTPKRDNEENFKGVIPWVKTGEVNGKLILNTSESISEEALKNSSCKIYPAGSIIIAMYGQGKTRGQVGILGIEACTNQACAVLLDKGNMNFGFIFNLLKMSYEDLRSLGRGGNQPNLNAGLIKSYSIIKPPLPLQNKFAAQIQEIEKQKAQAEASLQRAEDLFQSLLQKAFKGEL